MIYIASPYTSKEDGVMEDRYQEVCDFCARAVLGKNFVFSPIVHWHPIAITHILPGDADWWRKYNEDLLKKADELWVLRLDGWMESEGVLREVRFAKKHKIKISHYLKGGKRCTK